MGNDLYRRHTRRYEELYPEIFRDLRSAHDPGYDQLETEFRVGEEARRRKGSIRPLRDGEELPAAGFLDHYVDEDGFPVEDDSHLVPPHIEETLAVVRRGGADSVTLALKALGLEALHDESFEQDIPASSRSRPATEVALDEIRAQVWDHIRCWWGEARAGKSTRRTEARKRLRAIGGALAGDTRGHRSLHPLSPHLVSMLYYAYLLRLLRALILTDRFVRQRRAYPGEFEKARLRIAPHCGLSETALEEYLPLTVLDGEEYERRRPPETPEVYARVLVARRLGVGEHRIANLLGQAR